MFAAATTLLFILTNSVIAQASTPCSFAPLDIGSQVLSTDQFEPRYSATVELDGAMVTATIEVAERTVHIPDAMADQLTTILPLEPAKKIITRLSLTLDRNPSLGAVYSLKNKLVSSDGAFVNAFVSMENSRHAFSFVITPSRDGAMLVSATRNTDRTSAGSFVLQPTI